MDIQIRIRVRCSGTACHKDDVSPAPVRASGFDNTTVFDGWVDAQVAGTSHNVTLKSPVPPGWSSRVFEGSSREPICPTCTEVG